MKGFSVDGVLWGHHCQIRRVADMTPTDISGVLLGGAYFNDILGTYMSYEITVAVPMHQRDDYAALFEILTQPVDGHAFVLPYNATTISLTARVAQVSDEFYPTDGDGAYWLARAFTIVSNYPTKYMSLGDTLTRGMSPAPDRAEPAVGEVLQWDGDSWETYTPPSYPDADTTDY